MNLKSNSSSVKIRLIILLGFMLLLAPMLLTGCWDRREPDFIAIVDSVAFDYMEDKGLFRAIVQVANPLSGGGDQGNGGGGGGPSHWVVEGKGHTLFQALKDIEIRTTRQLLLSHIKLVIFSENLAKRGITPVLELLERERQSRMIAVPIVVRGDVRKVLEASFPMEELGGTAFVKQLSVIRLGRSVVPEVDSFRILAQRLGMPGHELILALAQYLEEEEEEDDDEDENSEEHKENPVKIAGSAVFRGDQLIGYLDERETAGYMWITGNVRRGTVILKCPGNEEELITVEVTESIAALEPIIRDNEVRFKLSLRVEGRIQEFYCNNLPVQDEFVSSLNRRMATAIRNEITLSLEKARELEVDIFGMGNLIYRTQNADWKRLEDRWEETFPTVMVDIEIEAFIRRHGLILRPSNIQ